MISNRTAVMFAIAILAVSFFYANADITGSAVRSKTGTYTTVIVGGAGVLGRNSEGEWYCTEADQCKEKFGLDYEYVKTDGARCNCINTKSPYTRAFGSAGFNTRVQGLCSEGTMRPTPEMGPSAFQRCVNKQWVQDYCPNNWKPVGNRLTRTVECRNRYY